MSDEDVAVLSAECAALRARLEQSEAALMAPLGILPTLPREPRPTICFSCNEERATPHTYRECAERLRGIHNEQVAKLGALRAQVRESRALLSRWTDAHAEVDSAVRDAAALVGAAEEVIAAARSGQPVAISAALAAYDAAGKEKKP